MAFFQSLPSDVKFALVAFIVVGLVAFFSHNKKTEKVYLVVLALLAVGGVYRYQSTKPVENTIAVQEVRPVLTTAPGRRPLVSTGAQ